MGFVAKCGYLVFACATLLSAQEPSSKAKTKAPDLALTAVGRQHHAIATRNAEAQQYFDQGLTFIYGFNHQEAVRAFQRAADLDPASPMPLWGVAVARTTTWMW